MKDYPGMEYQPEFSKIIKQRLVEFDLIQRVLDCEYPELTCQDKIQDFDGIPRPVLDTPSMRQVFWTSYWAGNLGMTPRDLDLPIETQYYWWLVKLEPGQFLPMHRDPAVLHSTEPVDRYWGMLQDYIPGHCFIINDTLITDYKAGDIWKWTDSSLPHGAFNMTGVPRISFQMGIGGEYAKSERSVNEKYLGREHIERPRGDGIGDEEIN